MLWNVFEGISFKTILLGGVVMKKVLLLILSLTMLTTVFVGCGSSKEPVQEKENASIEQSNTKEENVEKEEVKEEEPFKIGVAMNSADEYRSSWINAFTELAEQKGYTIYSTNADTDASKQISDVESLIAKEPDIIVMHAANADGSVPAVEAVEAAGIPCVLFDFPVNTDKYTTLITDQQYLNGVIQGEYVNKWLEEDPSRVANVGYIVGMYSMEAAMPRMDAFFETCKDAVKLSEKEGGWSADAAMSITEDWLQAYPEMNVFACMNDDMAIGCIQALTAAGKNMDDVLVLGIDGTEVGKEYIKSGELDCTAARDLNLETQFTLDTCEKILNGETVEKDLEPKAITALTKDNLK